MANNRTHRPENVRELVKWFRFKMRQDDDVVIAITGDTGSGKSTLERLLMRKLQDHRIDPELQFVWAANGLLEAARKLPEYSAIGVDEALAAGGNRRRAMSKGNVDVMEHLNTCRTFHHATIFCAPQFADLDLAVQTRCLGIIEVYKRGRFRWYELVKDSSVMERGVFPILRFEDAFPDDKDHPDPDAVALRLAYDDLKRRYSHQGSDQESPLKRALVQEFREKIRAVLDECDIHSLPQR